MHVSNPRKKVNAGVSTEDGTSRRSRVPVESLSMEDVKEITTISCPNLRVSKSVHSQDERRVRNVACRSMTLYHEECKCFPYRNGSNSALSPFFFALFLALLFHFWQDYLQLTCCMVDHCSLPRAQGNCTEKEPRWYYDTPAGRCMPFYYSGCGGNRNNFNSREACETDCPKEIRKFWFWNWYCLCISITWLSHYNERISCCFLSFLPIDKVGILIALIK